MFGECHAHIFMDGENYRNAVSVHKDQVNEQVVREHLKAYQERKISFVRDGGDCLGVSLLAKKLAWEYGIDYRTPVFAIHKQGHYGRIVGFGFQTMKEYKNLVEKAARAGADFIKIMTTGIMDFQYTERITGEPLTKEEIKEMIHIAHEEGFSVMSHTNTAQGVRNVIEAGGDSIEHGAFLTEEVIRELADSSSIWVPTVVTVKNLIGSGRYDDKIIQEIWRGLKKNLRYAFDRKVIIALGSDAGAYQVFHGQGTEDEYKAFCEVLGETSQLICRLTEAQEEIKKRFRRQ